ncbi:MAG: hypothetical protein K2Z81_20150 [Cyanobacteria bacterium]|nr:hypothetical protein [Cyanobacteriota bacterium]
MTRIRITTQTTTHTCGDDRMSIFQNSDDPARLCMILKTYMEEWGPENIVVFVPENWKSFSPSSLGKIRLEFDPANKVSIRVFSDNSYVSYDLDLRPEAAPQPFPAGQVPPTHPVIAV